MKRLSIRTYLSMGTLLFIALIVYASRHELIRAWELLAKVDVWVLLLVLPVVAIGYLAAGEMIFSYLRQKKSIKHISLLTQMRISMELNFVNHVLPSGGVSGVSYMNWRLGKLGVKTGRATMAQFVRYVAGAAAMVVLLVVAVVLVTLDGTVNRWIILMSCALVTVMIVATLLTMYLLKSVTRMNRFAYAVSKIVNTVVKKVTLGKVKRLITGEVIAKFLSDVQEDYDQLYKEKHLLVQPFLWGLFFTITEICIFSIVFWALGSPINPAPILIAYGLASIAGFAIVTPGGAGAYEAVMVLVLSIAGITQGEAIAGIVLTRAIILFVTIVGGYIFYQHALVVYGKKPKPTL
ncbi:MAG: lysylphosphatidylglycerol synthase transmembrane domain-containing protein [Candidatus Saccharimonas sp.]